MNHHAEIWAAIENGETDRARQLLSESLKNPDAETYYLAAHVAIDKEQQVDFLQQALQLDRFHQKAQLALKSGKLRQPSKDVETENISVMIASVKHATPLYVIPHLKGTHRGKLAAGSVVMPLTCGPHAEWFNVLYRDNKGVQSIGWLPIQDLDDFMLDDVRIIPSDLPLTQYEYFSKSELEELKRHNGIQSVSARVFRSPDYWRIMFFIFFVAFIGFLGIIPIVRGEDNTGACIVFWSLLLGYGSLFYLKTHFYRDYHAEYWKIDRLLHSQAYLKHDDLIENASLATVKLATDLRLRYKDRFES